MDRPQVHNVLIRQVGRLALTDPLGLRLGIVIGILKITVDISVLIKEASKRLAVTEDEIAPVTNTTQLIMRILFLVFGANQLFLVLVILNITNHLIVTLQEHLLVAAG